MIGYPVLRRRALGTIVAAAFAGRAFAQGAPSDPLPSWRPGPRRDAILRFVAAVTREGSAGFVPPRERIAVFDNDGTLWVEQPLYTQFIFILERVRALAPQNPAWRDDPVLRAAIDGDLQAVLAEGMRGLIRVAGAAQSGMAPDAFVETARDWIAHARDRRWNRPYTELIYQPMLELLDLLRANAFSTFIVSGGGVDFIRAFAEEVYGIEPQQVVGTTFGLLAGEQDGRFTLTRQDAIDFYDDGPGKPIGISRRIGRRPIAAFGNSDGDYEMLRYTTEGNCLRLGMIVHHDDAEREYAYDRDSRIGRLAKALDEAPPRGWQVISMREDWSRIFPG